jgi:hypothetical protein
MLTESASLLMLDKAQQRTAAAMGVQLVTVEN